MIHVVATISVKPGRKADFLEVFNNNLADVRAEDGCVEYGPTVDLDMGLAPQVLDESAVTVIEKWDSEDALRAHFTAPHMSVYRERVKGMVDDVTLKVLTDASS